jgi:hypothetical protein
MTKRALIYFGGLIAAVILLVGAAIAFNDSGSGEDTQVQQEDTSGGNAMGICLEGATDCVDTIDDGTGGDPQESPDADVSDDKPPEPDQPVVTSPPDNGGTSPAPDCSAPEVAPECQARATELALADLARRLGVDAATITVASIEDAVFDGCMGVEPPAGQACTEIGILGYEIVLEHNETLYVYHTDQGSKFVFVE